MERRDFLKGLAAASGAISAPALYGAQANRPAPQLLAQDNAPSRPPDDPWPGKKRILAIADPQEWYASAGYHHDSASHTLATVEKLGRESGAWITVIRTDMRLLTKQPIAGYNVRNLNHFDAVFYMGEGPWNITDQQKADLLSFVHEDGKGFIAGHAGNGGHLLLWPEYAEMIGGNLVGEFPSADMHIVVEDPNFPGVQGFPTRVYLSRPIHHRGAKLFERRRPRHHEDGPDQISRSVCRTTAGAQPESPSFFRAVSSQSQEASRLAHGWRLPHCLVQEVRQGPGVVLDVWASGGNAR